MSFFAKKAGVSPKMSMEDVDIFTRFVKYSPHFLLAILMLPVCGGLISVLLPAFGYAPVLEQTTVRLQGFIALWQTPGLAQMILLSVTTGLLSTLCAFVITLLMLGAFFNSQWLNLIQRLLSPILVIPHAAAAIAVGFLIAPSGMFSRLISPWLSGWEFAPAGILPHDPYGISIILGLILKELPFLLLMALSVLAQPEFGKTLRQQHKVALNLGYCPMTAFFKVILPSIYPLLRLPILAVLAYASASVEMPLILGPNTPSTLAVAIMHWFNDVDLNLRLQASAGAILQLILTSGLLLLWLMGEKIVKAFFCDSLTNGKRHYGDVFWQKITTILTVCVIAFILLALVGLMMWSVAGFWRFPALLPEQLTLLHVKSALVQMGNPIFNTLSIGFAATFSAIILTLLCLEAEQLSSKPLSNMTNLIIYLPLLVPSIAFLFGLVWVQQLIPIQSSFLNVVFSHLLFVLPYVFLSLASSYQRLDPRFAQVGASLGATPFNVFLQIKLPQLFAPILVAVALGLAISFGQYLPTLLVGGGRITTITTEAVTLANGASRRTSAVYGIMQMVLPLVGFILAWILPKYFFKSAHQGLLIFADYLIRTKFKHERSIDPNETNIAKGIEMQPCLQIKNLQLYRKNEQLLSLNEQVNGGEILTIMGPSGSGKSSLLNWIAGTLTKDFNATGEVWLNGKSINNLPAHLRHIGVLYQDPLLFSHLSVSDNVAFAIPKSKGAKKARFEKVEQALESVGLKGMGNRHPDNLSGGQQARVALLRMLLSEPKAILLDEPFSKLDTELRVATRQLVFNLIREHQLPAIMVSHDSSDADEANGKIITLHSRDNQHVR